MTSPKPWRDLTDAEKGALLLAHHEGKRIEVISIIGPAVWNSAPSPKFLDERVYRIAPEPLTPDSINWEHVSPEYNFMARELDGVTLLWSERPRAVRGSWSTNADGVEYVVSVEYFASYRRGTVTWQDSLVIRPGYEAS